MPSSNSDNFDVAVSQNLYRDNIVSELVKGYGQIICNGCHHVSAVGFEQILKTSLAQKSIRDCLKRNFSHLSGFTNCMVS